MKSLSEIQADKVVRTICSLCPNQDGILVYVKNGKVVDIEGDLEHPFTKGHICIKGQRSYETLYHPQRITHPLTRKREGWRRVSWEEALETIADRLQEVRDRYGPQAICGANCIPELTEGLALTLFIRSLGSPNVMNNLDLCAGTGMIADTVTLGNRISTYWSVTDFRNSKCILLAGTNPPESLPLQWRDIRHALTNGAKLIVVDPRRTECAQRADIWLQIRPGTDGALVLGILNVIINEKLYDEEFVNQWCVGFERLKERVAEYPLDKVEKITGVAAEDIQKAAQMFAETKPACLRANNGVMQRNNSVQTARAFAILTSITGNIDIPGGNSIATLPKGFNSGRRLLREYCLPEEVERNQLGAEEFPLWTGPDSIMMSVCHNPTVLRAMATGSPYPIKAMLVLGTNPVMTYPDTRKVLEALKKLEFLVVFAYTMSPTAEFADVILPRVHPLERNDVLVNPYGRWLGVMQKAVEPPGECWDDIKILVELSRKMEQKGYIQKSFIPWGSLSELIEYRLENTGTTFEELSQKGPMVVPPKYRKYEERGFRTPSGKVELYSSILEKYGYDPLPSYQESPESQLSTPRLAQKYPLMLITSRKLPHFLSRSSEYAWVRELTPYPELEIHPDTAEERGIREGDLIWVETAKGGCKHRAKITDTIHPQVVNGWFGWWFPEKPAPERGCLEANINTAMSYDPPYDPVVGINSVQGVLCEVGKVEEEGSSP